MKPTSERRSKQGERTSRRRVPLVGRAGVRGSSLAEMLVALAVLGIGAAIAVPPLLDISSALRVDLAAREVASALQRAKSLAVRKSAYVAVRFRVGPGGDVTFALYRDGDGDGVLNKDIESGADPEVEPPRRLEHVGADVRFGIPRRPVRDPGDPRSLLTGTDDPVRFNRSDLASFGPLGGSTPGSLYLTDGEDRLAVVRVFGRTGKILVLTYDFAAEAWR